MRDPRRSYKAYEELGRRLDRLHEAIADVQGQLMDMWQEVDEQGAPVPSHYEDLMLKVVFALKDLERWMAQEFHAEIDGPDVPPGKPRTPPPLGREGW